MNPLSIVLLAEALLFAFGALGMYALRAPFVETPDPYRDTLAFLALYLALKGSEALFARLFPDSYRTAEGLIRQVAARIPEQAVLPLALLSALAEEVFFRGFLITLFERVVPPAAALFLAAFVFMLFHPVPDRRAYAYPLYVGLAGVFFGLAYLLTGSLIPGILAHYLVNAEGLLEARRGTSVPPGSVS